MKNASAMTARPTVIVSRSGCRQIATSTVVIATISSTAPTTTAGTAPNWTTPAPQRSAGVLSASQAHCPEFARLSPRSLGTSAQVLYAFTVRYG